MAQFIGKDFVPYAYDKGATKRDFLLKMAEEAFTDKKYKDDAFMVLDIGDVLKKYETWKRELPSVTPFYTVKCMPYLPIIKVLAEIGCGFDCASPQEIDKVLSAGVSPSRIVYSHTMKQRSYLQHASECNVDLMTFDDETELLKVKETFPNARLLLRLSIYDTTAQVPFGFKFGCHHKHVKYMMEFAKEHGMQLEGVHFHIGSGSHNPEMFENALQFARKVFDVGHHLGFNMNVLDIGGGFPGSPRYPTQFAPFAASLREAIANYFPPESGVTIIAEPGRYFTESAVTLVANLIGIKTRIKSSSSAGISSTQRRQSGKRPALTRQPSSTTTRRKISRGESIGTFAEQSGIPDVSNPFTYDYMYFINDGLFSSFLRNIVGFPVLPPQPLKKVKDDEEEFMCMIVGETCPEEDSILDECMLPKLQIGDYLVFEDMGAYTCMATGFNGFEKKIFYYAVPENVWSVIYPLLATCTEKLSGTDQGEDSQSKENNNDVLNGKLVRQLNIDQCDSISILQDIWVLGDYHAVRI